MHFYFKNYQNGFFRDVFYKICNFVQSYLISCLVQLLDLTFHEILHFRKKYINFLSLLFLTYRRLTLHFTVFLQHSPPRSLTTIPPSHFTLPHFPSKKLEGARG